MFLRVRCSYSNIPKKSLKIFYCLQNKPCVIVFDVKVTYLECHCAFLTDITTEVIYTTQYAVIYNKKEIPVYNDGNF